MNGEPSAARQIKSKWSFLVLLLCLGGALAVLCHQGFGPNQVFFNNDTSLGYFKNSAGGLPSVFFGKWSNFEFVGGPDVSSSPSFTTIWQMICGAELYMKTLVPVSMFFLGFSVWLFFRQLRFASGVCVVAGLAAGLNMHFFSNACWGLGMWCVSAGMLFVALAILVSPTIRPLWVKAALAGLSIGMVVMQGFDVGAIFSLYFGAFMVFYFLSERPNPILCLPKTVLTGSVLVFFALIISASTIYTLIGSTFTEKASTGDTETGKKEHWIFLTTYSLPKMESLRLIIPGLYGYRLQEFMTDTNKSSAYWGTIAEDFRVQELESSSPKDRAQGVADLGIPNPEVQKILEGPNTATRDEIMDNIKGQLSRRHTGSGDYIGELVCLLAVFGLFSSWRKTNSPYSKSERETVWFWGVAALISLLASWGRYGTVYHLIAPLPFLRNIRNPIKFLHPLNIAMIILAGYGMEALHRRYLRGAMTSTAALPAHVLRWWKKADRFEKNWVIGTVLFTVLAFVSFCILSSSKGDLVHHLEHSGFSEEMAPQMAGFCINEVLFFVILFALSAGVIIGILSGAWSGNRAVIAWIMLGAIMVVDISRSDFPWVRYYDYKEKYSPNPVTDFLSHDVYEHRVVSARRSPVQPVYDLTQDQTFGAMCHFWLENDYMADNIQALEIDQAPRMPDLERNYIGLFNPKSQQDLASTARLWRLTNTRYILADANLTPVLNQVIEPKNSFHNVMRFDLAMKPGITQPEDAGDLTITTNDNGHIALIDYNGVLPRAKLYSNWQMADDAMTLAKLESPDFDPARQVLVATNTPVEQKSTAPDADPGTVSIVDYHPKYIKLQADAKTPAVLLFNERVGDHWNVWVDDKPSTVLRCNYIMRGAFVPQGRHTIVFRFQPPITFLWVTLSAFGAGLLLIGYVVVTHKRHVNEEISETEKSA